MSEFKVGDVVYFKGDRGIIREVTSDDKERLYRVDVTETAVHYLSEHQFEVRGQELHDNQQIVLDILKDIQTTWSHFHPSTTIKMMVEKQSEYFEELTKNQELEVFKVFIGWVLEQEEAE